jgi:hypothetical protein
MGKLILGIDISLDSTGIVAICDGKTEYCSVYNIRKGRSAKVVEADKVIFEHPILSVMTTIMNATIIPVERFVISQKQEKPKKGQLTDTTQMQVWERAHMKWCISTASAMVKAVIAYAKKFNITSMNDVYINIENYSYGSQQSGGSSTIQITELTGIFKSKLLDYIPYENIEVTPGPTLKQFVGKGSFDKFDMLSVYTQQTHNKDDKFAMYVMAHFDSLYKIVTKGVGSTVKKDVLAPISDIIDAWWLARYAYKKLAI